MEQLVWAIIFIVFFIIIALKNKARRKAETSVEETTGAKRKRSVEQGELGRYLEEIFGIETEEPQPHIVVEEEKLKPLETRIEPKIELKLISETEKRFGEFTSPLIKKYKEEKKPFIPEKKEIYHAKFPWGTMLGKDLPRAIILSEIIGPPIAKRKSHRLF